MPKGLLQSPADSTLGHELICMLDVYQDYHQIPLAFKGQEKVSFNTSNGIFYYTVMLFGFKNAGAIYQRLMDEIFKEQMGRNIEVYVDDILVNSSWVKKLIVDMEKIFASLRRYKLKLNPNKYIFRVKGGNFLGYLITERGIEANLKKVRALQDMRTPQNTREVQRLIGRIIVLSRIIFKSVDRNLFFFKIL